MGSLQGRGGLQQITIFYSGGVNVYDHVPAHKVQAIMLLLAADHCSSNSSVTADWGKDLSMETPQPLSKSVLIGCAKASCPPARGHPLIPAMPTIENAPITQFIKIKQPPIIRKRSQAELPFARKASLTRFLEKRKDRVLEAMKVNEEVEASCAKADVEALGSPRSKRMKH